MGAVRAQIAERRRTAVYLNLPELAVLLAAATAGNGRDRDLRSAAQRVERARNRRERAVRRAEGR